MAEGEAIPLAADSALAGKRHFVVRYDHDEAIALNTDGHSIVCQEALRLVVLQDFQPAKIEG